MLNVTFHDMKIQKHILESLKILGCRMRTGGLPFSARAGVTVWPETNGKRANLTQFMITCDYFWFFICYYTSFKYEPFRPYY